jgi:hypothetical protein
MCANDVAPFCRAAIGAFFGMVIGGAWLLKGFWAALLIFIFMLLGALIAVLATGPTE